MMYAADFRREGFQALRGKWGVAVGTGFVASLFGVATTMTTANKGTAQIQLDDGSFSNAVNTGTYFDGIELITLNELQIAIFAVMATIMTVIMVISIIRFIVSGAMTLGYAKFNLRLVDEENVSFGTLFSEFKRFGTGLLMQVLRFVYILLWTMLFVIPGIIACHSYALTPYILIDHPELSANEAIRKSKEMMDGNKWRLFCMQFSFIGWSLLCAFFTLGIGYLWLMPYIEAANAAFYREIAGKKAVEPAKENDAYDDSYRYRDLNEE